ncbi:DUF1214 domain-containing protein [Jiella sp. MQZ9-1]|uniref:DUF1214 domain-containing protein n=1 Tax=Jiella flava TaxID=2816857 RepID=A0A939G0E7_9HYPH|nr:DUF1214 domain-containing protein [Jiella flava]MBO0663298.1 DUF1214 domain-containing protein [Jiella flava]MCD2471874.1 DUF1214 domain-containing protein [Jiella flava]
MQFTLLVMIAVGIALYLGGWSAKWAVKESSEIATVEVGQWKATPFAGAPDADPYSKARLAMIGNLNLGIGEGIQFRGSADDSGQPLRRECSYSIEGTTPPARIFTLAAYMPEGQLITPAAGRPGWLTSNNLMRNDDNSFAIAVGPTARAGNWLATSGTGQMILVLALYDTPASAESGASSLTLPTIHREECRRG